MNHAPLLTTLLRSFMLLAVCAAGGFAADGDPRQAGREALDELGRYPWYDRAADDFQPLGSPPRRAAAPPSSTSGGTVNPRAAIDILEWLGWTLLVLLLLGLAWLLLRFFLNRERSATADDTANITIALPRAAQIEALPEEIRSVHDLLGEARRRANAGRYSEAVIFLFGHQLLSLDRAQLLRLAKGKTNRQYLRELREHGSLRAVLEQTVGCFEDVFFGKHELSRERFESCWSLLPRFDSLLQGVAA